MKPAITHVLGAVLTLLVLPLTTNAAPGLCGTTPVTQVYDLKTDWSDTQNPNGPWSYRDLQGALLSIAPFPWSDVPNTEGVDAIIRADSASVVPGFLELGDIYVSHVFGSLVRWTAPAAGAINISGNSWGENCQFRWILKHNGSAFNDGSGGGGTRSAPNDFSSGSGGASALQNIAVKAGDKIEFVLWDFLNFWLSDLPNVNGVNFTVSLTTSSVDPVAAIENLARAVFEMNLQNGIENSLDTKLDAALNALIDASLNNDGAASNFLAAFINAVEAQRGNKISSSQADQLICAAQEIQNMLSGSS
jgi:hypothetical protein